MSAAGSYRFCAAADCPNDAQLSSPFCDSCERKLRTRGPNAVQLHRVEQTVFDPETMLPCLGGCARDLPDEAFTPWFYRGDARAERRRNRHGECRECAAARRRKKRLDPEVRAREAANQRRSRLKRLSTEATPRG